MARTLEDGKVQNVSFSHSLDIIQVMDEEMEIFSSETRIFESRLR